MKDAFQALMVDGHCLLGVTLCTYSRDYTSFFLNVCGVSPAEKLDSLKNFHNSNKSALKRIKIELNHLSV